jgi:hypothetical protein
LPHTRRALFPPYPFSPWKILKMAVVANSRKAYLSHYLPTAVSIRTLRIAIHTERPTLHRITARANIPCRETKERNLHLIKTVINIGLLPRWKTKMADLEALFKARLLNFDDSDLLEICSSKPKVQSCSYNNARALKNMQCSNAKGGDQLVSAESGLETHFCKTEQVGCPWSSGV